MSKIDLDLVVLMKKTYTEQGIIKFIPVKVVEGLYDEESMCFIDTDGTIYYHIICEPETYGFYARENFDNIKSKENTLTLSQIKRNKYKKMKDLEFLYLDEDSSEIGVPIIGEYDFKNKKAEQVFDGDILSFYYKYYPEYFNELFKNDDEQEVEKKSTSETIDVGIDVPKLYNEVTKRVIDQDEPIKKILTAIWKQYSNYSDSKSRNILINGSTGVGKTETFRVLSNLIDVPMIITSATEYTATGYVGKSVDNMLADLIRKADGDIDKAQKGILIIDEIDKISESNSGQSQVNQRDVQEALLKILEDGVFDIEVDHHHYSFDTSNLMVVGMGSWSRIDLTPSKTVGFECKTVKKSYKDITREDIVKNGLIPELVGRFSIIVQMNELGYDSFVKILNSPNNAIALNKKFFHENGVELIIDDKVIDAIAKKASLNNYGARGLDEIVENALSYVAFEIANNPGKYSELIITEETISDNKKYLLVEKEQVKKLCKKNN